MYKHPLAATSIVPILLKKPLSLKAAFSLRLSFAAFTQSEIQNLMSPTYLALTLKNHTRRQRLLLYQQNLARSLCAHENQVCLLVAERRANFAVKVLAVALLDSALF